MSKGKFKKVNNKVDFIDLEHQILKKWKSEDTFNQLRNKNKGIRFEKKFDQSDDLLCDSNT